MGRDTCNVCGNPIEFITKDGRAIPLHTIEHCTGIQQNPTSRGAHTTLYESTCWRTKCPYCDDSVFFVRHNGGSAWFDELGQPWPKHPCMDFLRHDAVTPASQPTNFPKTECDGEVIYVGPYIGSRNRYILIEWDNGDINAYTFLWMNKYATMMKPHLAVHYNPIDGTAVMVGKKRKTKLLLDKSICPGTRGIDLQEFKQAIERL